MEKDSQYIKAFNQGFVFQKERPILAKRISEAFHDKDTEFKHGFLDGGLQYKREMSLESLRLKRKNNSRDRN